MSPIFTCDLGAQSYSFRNFDYQGAIRCLKRLGLDSIEFCNVHFPPDPSNPALPEIRKHIAREGVKVRCFGVEAFTGDHDANRRKFEFARELRAQVLTADPAPDSFDSLDRLTEKFGIKVAIHNHGPGARYDKVEDTLHAIESHSIMIGACVDTGHALRSGEMPHNLIARLGVRLISLHLKDWKVGGDEQILGEGDMNLVEVARALHAINFMGPIMIEYENSPDNPVPDMKRGIGNWLNACSFLQ